MLMTDEHRKMIEDLPPDWREMFEERAAIRYWEGQQTLDRAEFEALRETREKMAKEERANG